MRTTLKNIHINDDGRDIFDFTKNILSNKTLIKNVIGFVIYFILCIITIPTLLYKRGFYNILEVYLPNVDLLANLLSFHGGPEKYNIFEYLYVPSPTNTYAFVSQTIVNYMALLGLTYIIARETKLTNSIVKGWSLAFIMILVTYLLPSQIISEIMERLNTFLSSYTNIHQTILWNFVVFFGFILTISIIYFEKYLLLHLRGSIINVGKFIIRFPSTV
jgi:hypothetical protein